MSSGTRSSETFLQLNTGPGAAAYNMALDEALLEMMPFLGRPVLRFYGWTEPAASFGYFQRYAEVERLTPLRPLVRRPTGGGIVPHAHDWTYSLAFPPSHEWYDLHATESYRRVHEWLRAAFALLGVETTLAPEPLKTLPGQCFVGYERSDLLYHSRKIAGAAQRRRRDGLLIQGSVQPPLGTLARSAWEQAMGEVASRDYCTVWQPLAIDAALAKRASDLTEAKYLRPAYNQRR